MQIVWTVIIYFLAQLFDWKVGRGKHEGIDWFARIGLDFCRMGVTIFGILLVLAIDRNPGCSKFDNAINNFGLNNYRGWTILILLMSIFIFWIVAFILDNLQVEIKRRRKMKFREKTIKRTLCITGINTIGAFLFLTPLQYLF